MSGNERKEIKTKNSGETAVWKWHMNTTTVDLMLLFRSEEGGDMILGLFGGETFEEEGKCFAHGFFGTELLEKGEEGVDIGRLDIGGGSAGYLGDEEEEILTGGGMFADTLEHGREDIRMSP